MKGALVLLEEELLPQQGTYNTGLMKEVIDKYLPSCYHFYIMEREVSAMLKSLKREEYKKYNTSIGPCLFQHAAF